MASLNLIVCFSFTEFTYGDLIDIYVTVESDSPTNMADALCAEISKHSTVCIKRPGRFLDTVQRIVGPTKPSLKGPPKLTGSPLSSYRKRIWTPRVRTSSCAGMHIHN